MRKDVPMERSLQFWRLVTVLLAVAVGVLAVVVAVLLTRPVKTVSTFRQCKEAGGVLLTTLPEQCVINDTTFTGNMQLVSGDAYVGLLEAEALANAEQAHTPARVVERDGEGLPVTMDFAFGRHNFYVRDGVVYKVEIEGQATDD